MRFSDKVAGIAIALFGALILYLSRSFRSFQHIEYGPGFFPSLLGIGFIIAGLVLAGRSFARKDSAKLVAVGVWGRSPRHLGNVLAFLGSLLIYILISETLGFLPTAFILLSIMIFWFWRKVWGSVLISLIATVLIWKFFGGFMMVPLPWGILEPYAGYLTWP